MFFLFGRFSGCLVPKRMHPATLLQYRTLYQSTHFCPKCGRNTSILIIICQPTRLGASLDYHDNVETENAELELALAPVKLFFVAGKFLGVRPNTAGYTFHNCIFYMCPCQDRRGHVDMRDK